MSDDLTFDGKTQLGQLDFKLAAAACYVPIMYLHLAASIAFLAMEPKDHRIVRFHAAQSLIGFVAWMAGLFLAFLITFVVPVLFMVLGGAAGSVLGDEIGALFAVLGALLQLAMALVLLVVALAFPVGFVVLAVLCAMGTHVRLPLVGGLAERFSG